MAQTRAGSGVVVDVLVVDLEGTDVVGDQVVVAGATVGGLAEVSEGPAGDSAESDAELSIPTAVVLMPISAGS